ncbi:glycine cleavage system T protein [Mytilinidion resinicola]|uniref:Aminomethyltransferase n=1 Tax=Mytilinidion resinicola TaxID=574789 RepID=A0A6A6YZZ0_9PEZI|nr:glycine cleavage system T protein [Mytilinidion resinicola]KAF2813495.1 glycine cleavage system T protein [Mytilinidion resinicola]
MSAKRGIRLLQPAIAGAGRLASHPNSASNALHTLRPLSTPCRRPRISVRTPSASNALRFASSQADEPAKTPLYDLHAAHGAKFVPFGGYAMPVQYGDLSVGESHHWTREKASLFDVSHMVQHHFSGPGADAFLSLITPSSLSTLKPHHSTLSTLLHRETGGIVDDTVITRLDATHFYVVTNAGCRAKDLEYLQTELAAWKEAGNPDVKWDVLEGQGLVALQGPAAADVLASVIADPEKVKLDELYFGQSKYASIRIANWNTSPEVLISRGGYTGEDGFEISIPGSSTVAVTEKLLSAAPDAVRLAGLGARDSLRLEAGMCLYGHDLDDSTTPVEAALAWVVGKDRRAEGGFHGSSVILSQLKPKKDGGNGVTRRRIGLVVDGAPAREGASIVDAEDNVIGTVTSGCPSPTLKKNIAMAYIKDGSHKSGTEVAVLIRGKRRKAVVTKMPFVPSKYYRGP